jgi:hypothetical protein
MGLVFNPGVFALGIAVGVLGLVLLLSLIISYAYDESTLLGLAAYLSLMVAATLTGQRLQISDELIENLLLVAGPALLTALHVRLLKSRYTTGLAKAAIAVLVLLTLALLGFFAAGGPKALEQPLSMLWFAAVLLFAVYLLVQSWQSAGPWKWWLMLGHGAGLAIALGCLTDLVDTRQAYWSVVLMLLFQVPQPICRWSGAAAC